MSTKYTIQKEKKDFIIFVAKWASVWTIVFVVYGISMSMYATAFVLKLPELCKQVNIALDNKFLEMMKK